MIHLPGIVQVKRRGQIIKRFGVILSEVLDGKLVGRESHAGNIRFSGGFQSLTIGDGAHSAVRGRGTS
jgi:hypothetical protein